MATNLRCLHHLRKGLTCSRSRSEVAQMCQTLRFVVILVSARCDWNGIPTKRNSQAELLGCLLVFRLLVQGSEAQCFLKLVTHPHLAKNAEPIAVWQQASASPLPSQKMPWTVTD